MPVVLIAVMKDGLHIMCTECDACYCIILRKDIEHNCCENVHDTVISEEQLSFIANLIEVYEIPISPAA